MASSLSPLGASPQQPLAHQISSDDLNKIDGLHRVDILLCESIKRNEPYAFPPDYPSHWVSHKWLYTSLIKDALEKLVDGWQDLQDVKYFCTKNMKKWNTDEETLINHAIIKSALKISKIYKQLIIANHPRLKDTPLLRDNSDKILPPDYKKLIKLYPFEQEHMKRLESEKKKLTEDDNKNLEDTINYLEYERSQNQAAKEARLKVLNKKHPPEKRRLSNNEEVFIYHPDVIKEGAKFREKEEKLNNKIIDLEHELNQNKVKIKEIELQMQDILALPFQSASSDLVQRMLSSLLELDRFNNEEEMIELEEQKDKETIKKLREENKTLEQEMEDLDKGFSTYKRRAEEDEMQAQALSGSESAGRYLAKTENSNNWKMAYMKEKSKLMQKWEKNCNEIGRLNHYINQNSKKIKKPEAPSLYNSVSSSSPSSSVGPTDSLLIKIARLESSIKIGDGTIEKRDLWNRLLHNYKLELNTNQPIEAASSIMLPLAYSKDEELSGKLLANLILELKRNDGPYLILEQKRNEAKRKKKEKLENSVLEHQQAIEAIQLQIRNIEKPIAPSLPPSKEPAAESPRGLPLPTGEPSKAHTLDSLQSAQETPEKKNESYLEKIGQLDSSSQLPFSREANNHNLSMKEKIKENLESWVLENQEKIGEIRLQIEKIFSSLSANEKEKRILEKKVLRHQQAIEAIQLEIKSISASSSMPSSFNEKEKKKLENKVLERQQAIEAIQRQIRNISESSSMNETEKKKLENKVLEYQQVIEAIQLKIRNISEEKPIATMLPPSKESAAESPMSLPHAPGGPRETATLDSLQSAQQTEEKKKYADCVRSSG
jgi:hypothetical protein